MQFVQLNQASVWPLYGSERLFRDPFVDDKKRESHAPSVQFGMDPFVGGGLVAGALYARHQLVVQQAKRAFREQLQRDGQTQADIEHLTQEAMTHRYPELRRMGLETYLGLNVSLAEKIIAAETLRSDKHRDVRTFANENWLDLIWKRDFPGLQLRYDEMPGQRRVIIAEALASRNPDIRLAGLAWLEGRELALSPAERLALVHDTFQDSNTEVRQKSRELCQRFEGMMVELKRLNPA